MKTHKWQKQEIIWHIVNSLLTGILILLGSLTSGNITKEGFIVALIASVIVIVMKFKDYWSGEEKEYSVKLFKFI